MVPGRNHSPTADASSATSGDGAAARTNVAAARTRGGTARDRALNLLSFRDRSRRELEARLLRGGFDPDEVVEALDGLERAGLVDDERFARAVVEQEAGRRLSGRRAVASALAASGVDRDAARAALAELDDSDEERRRADELARARAARLVGLPPEAAFRRLASLLARRGYAPGICRDAARRALAVDQIDPES